MTSTGRLVLYKRWRLRDGVTPEDVRRFVVREIVPRYAALSDDVVLGLEADTDGRSVLAVQRWLSADAHRRTMDGPTFDAWWAEYEPRLAEWDHLVEFADEWSTVEVELGGR